MKTILNLDDDLMQAARERARRMGVTLTAGSSLYQVDLVIK
ncbi:MAG: hypothetical protein ACRDTA_29065 [Pseudonocardiaceae bacterium]